MEITNLLQQLKLLKSLYPEHVADIEQKLAKDIEWLAESLKFRGSVLVNSDYMRTYCNITQEGIDQVRDNEILVLAYNQGGGLGRRRGTLVVLAIHRSAEPYACQFRSAFYNKHLSLEYLKSLGVTPLFMARDKDVIEVISGENNNNLQVEYELPPGSRIWMPHHGWCNADSFVIWF